MIHEIQFHLDRLADNEELRIVLIRKDWEIHVDNKALIHQTDGMIRIVRSNGRVVSINPSQIMMLCTMKKGDFV